MLHIFLICMRINVSLTLPLALQYSAITRIKLYFGLQILHCSIVYDYFFWYNNAKIVYINFKMLKIGEIWTCAWTIDILSMIDLSISRQTNTPFIDWFKYLHIVEHVMKNKSKLNKLFKFTLEFFWVCAYYWHFAILSMCDVQILLKFVDKAYSGRALYTVT